MGNLIEELHKEMERVRELIIEYEALPDRVGFMGAAVMRGAIKQAEKSIESGDVVEEVRAYANLKECTG